MSGWGCTSVGFVEARVDASSLQLATSPRTRDGTADVRPGVLDRRRVGVGSAVFPRAMRAAEADYVRQTVAAAAAPDGARASVRARDVAELERVAAPLRSRAFGAAVPGVVDVLTVRGLLRRLAGLLLRLMHPSEPTAVSVGFALRHDADAGDYLVVAHPIPRGAALLRPAPWRRPNRAPSGAAVGFALPCLLAGDAPLARYCADEVWHLVAMPARRWLYCAEVDGRTEPSGRLVEVKTLTGGRYLASTYGMALLQSIFGAVDELWLYVHNTTTVQQALHVPVPSGPAARCPCPAGCEGLQTLVVDHFDAACASIDALFAAMVSCTRLGSDRCFHATVSAVDGALKLSDVTPVSNDRLFYFV